MIFVPYLFVSRTKINVKTFYLVEEKRFSYLMQRTGTPPASHVSFPPLYTSTRQ